MKKTILEQALVCLLNEEQEKAQELMHQYIIESAREIHDSLREADDAMDNIGDEEDEDRFFSDADLSDAEEGDGDFGAEAEIESAADDLGDAMDVPSEDDFSGEDGGDLAADNFEDKIDQIEDEIAELAAKFEEMMASMDDDGEGEEGEFDFDAPEGSEEASEEGAEFDDGAEVSDEGSEEEEEVTEDEDYDDITESVIDELKKISVPNTDGRTATGSAGITPSKSMSSPRDKKAAPIKSTGAPHKGFDREKAPAVTDLKGGSTTAKGARNVGNTLTPAKKK